MMIERRSRERARSSIEARWRAGSGEWLGGRVSNLGAGGCFIETAEEVAVGEVLSFEVRMPWGYYWSPLRGEVMRHEPGAGFGLGFVDLSMAEQTLIAQLIINAPPKKIL
jgi:hypothetical protein